MTKRTRHRAAMAARLAGLALLVAIAMGAVYEEVGRRNDETRMPRIGRAIDIGGRSMNIHCSGDGQPAVIFDSGWGDPGIVWSDIQSEIAKLTRACWFDRAGNGWSDSGPFPRTSEAMARDLHELLHRARVPGPYVLVGHSLGGLNARVYTGMYPGDVAGAVLVDAAHEDEPRRAPAFMLGHTAPRFLWRPIWTAGRIARAVGLLRLAAPRVELPRDSTRWTRDAIMRALRAQPKALAAMFDPTAPASYAQAERSSGFGDRPLIVLTRGDARLPLNPSPIDRDAYAYEQVWMHEIQPKLARLSTHGRQIIVPQSGHRIHETAPDVVTAAIREVVADITSARGRPD